MERGGVKKKERGEEGKEKENKKYMRIVGENREKLRTFPPENEGQ